MSGLSWITIAGIVVVAIAILLYLALNSMGRITRILFGTSAKASIEHGNIKPDIIGELTERNITAKIGKDDDPN